MGKGFELVDKQTRKALAINQLDIGIRIQAFLAGMLKRDTRRVFFFIRMK